MPLVESPRAMILQDITSRAIKGTAAPILRNLPLANEFLVISQPPLWVEIPSAPQSIHARKRAIPFEKAA